MSETVILRVEVTLREHRKPHLTRAMLANAVEDRICDGLKYIDGIDVVKVIVEKEAVNARGRDQAGEVAGRSEKES